MFFFLMLAPKLVHNILYSIWKFQILYNSLLSFFSLAQLANLFLAVGISRMAPGELRSDIDLCSKRSTGGDAILQPT